MISADASVNRVLLVTADRFRPEAGYEQVYTVISDAAGACLVSRGCESCRLEQFHALSNAGMHAFSPEQQVGGFFNYHQTLLLELLAKSGLLIGDVDWILPQNTNRDAWTIMARILRIDPGKIRMCAMADYGHTIGCDTLLNLRDLLRSDTGKPGDRLVMCTVGHGMNWQACLLTR
jgi:3-oxoacyl-[acyl-carrier-protein] synthase-3